MSSIDKYVEEAARNVDSRVRVTNVGGRIVGRINGVKVFDIADRYGYLHDDEKSIVQAGVRRYLRQEMEQREEERRRREEEERRRREEEERRRREEEERRRRLEAQRQATIATARTAVANKRQEVERFFANVQNPVGGTPTLDPEISSMFDMGEVVQSAQKDINALRADFNKKVAEKKNSVMAQIQDQERRINAGMTTESANAVISGAGGVHPSFDPSSFTDRYNQLNAGVGAIMTAARGMMQQLKAFDARFHNESSAALLRRVKNIKIRSSADFAQISTMIEETAANLQDQAAREALEAAGRELTKAQGQLSSLSLSCDVKLGEEYEKPSFATEIAQQKQRILELRNNLLHGEYTTMSAATSEEIARFYDSDEDSEEALRACSSIIDKLQTIAVEDKRLEGKYNIFQRTVAEARNRGLDIDPRFDPTAPDAQTDAIAEQIFEKELEEAKEELWSRQFSVDSVMGKLGYEMLAVEEVAGCMMVTTYARKGMDGALMQVVVTESGVRRRLIGVKAQGQESSVETVKEAGRMLEREDEPARFMQEYTALYPDAVMAEDFGLADDPGIEEVIEGNGCYDLDANNKTQQFRQIAGERKVTSTYIPARNHDVSVTIAKEASRVRQKMKTQSKARYQTLS